ncbi:preprotein translocase subunit SecA [bacterium]|nr:preprotein translocase subunit SecA [bacterium]
MKILNKILGDPNDKIIKSLQPVVDKINDWESTISKLNDEELREMTVRFRKRLGIDSSEKEIKDIDKKLEEILPEVFAVVREASKRTVSMRHFDVQLLGGIILFQGKITEMKTGEGKTLVATLPLYLRALTGKGVQLVTVNDYLARVGSGWMSEIYNFLGLSVGVITGEGSYIYDTNFIDDSQYDKRLKHLKQVNRKEAYECDIIYGTNNEFGFDYLRDNMAPSLDSQVQRGLTYAIIDEIDSILIDEARTPLIISAPAEKSTDRYYKFSNLVKKLEEDKDYNVDEKMRAVTLTEQGISRMEGWLGMGNIYVEKGIREVHHIEQALKANVLFKKEKDYVVKDGEVIIVDEFTGRLMPGRRYSEGLHQAIEAKEGVDIKRESQTLATITFQNYFRMYEKISGMTGTAVTEAEEFVKIYNLDTVIIPTHKPMIRKDRNDLIFRTEEGKFKAVIRDVKEKSEKGQPVLIGTASIEKNELLADMMQREGLEPQILNAKNHEKEAKIIAQAGRKGAITIATNMAGRGVDIILGGDPSSRGEHDEIKRLGGLHVLGTERHESRRIDNQLRGRAGRQGDPGSSQFYVSTDDDLMRIFGGDRMKRIMATLKVPEDVPIENKIISKSIESAQKKVEGNNFDIRKHLVEYDDVINKHREAIYKRRKEILELAKKDGDKNGGLSKIVLEMIENEIEQVVSFHTSAEKISDWNLEEIYQVVSTIFPVKDKLKDDLSDLVSDNTKLDKARARTALIEHLVGLSRDNYKEIEEKAKEHGISWYQVEKEILVRAIDALWIDHLEAMSHMRQGIGLRGYGQRDPLIEYKRESHRMFHELNHMIQRQVVYSVFKLGISDKRVEGSFSAPTLLERAQQFSAPAKTMSSSSSKGNVTSNNYKPKIKNDQGNKVGRNDSCPCGSGKKYKKCCGK